MWPPNEEFRSKINSGEFDSSKKRCHVRREKKTEESDITGRNGSYFISDKVHRKQSTNREYPC